MIMADETAVNPPAPDTKPLRSVHTSNFPQLLEQLGISLLVTTYQAGKLVVARADGEHVNTHFRNFQSPMGLAADGRRFAPILFPPPPPPVKLSGGDTRASNREEIMSRYRWTASWCAAALVAATLAGVPLAAAAGSAQVEFVKPESFTDVGPKHAPSNADDVLEKLRVHLVRRVRSTPELAATPILVTTGFGTGSATFTLAQGADAYEPKPLDPDSLRETVRRLLS